MININNIITIIDYGLGNHFSLLYCLRNIGFRVSISNDQNILENSNILILPGVGSFSKAIQNIEELELKNFLIKQSKKGTKIVGICLGMQLLANCSYENGKNQGLGLIPGSIMPLKNMNSHIGWNTLEVNSKEDFFKEFDGKEAYFNHSFAYQGDEKYIIARTCINEENSNTVAMIKNKNTIGLQFHPEKSQLNGLRLLKKILTKF